LHAHIRENDEVELTTNPKACALSLGSLRMEKSGGILKKKKNEE